MIARWKPRWKQAREQNDDMCSRCAVSTFPIKEQRRCGSNKMSTFKHECCFTTHRCCSSDFGGDLDVPSNLDEFPQDVTMSNTEIGREMLPFDSDSLKSGVIHFEKQRSAKHITASYQ